MADDQATELQRTIKSFILTEVQAGGSVGEIGADDDLIRAGIVDSLGVQQIITFMETRFGIVVDDMDLLPENFKTVAAMGAFVTRRQAERGRAPKRKFFLGRL